MVFLYDSSDYSYDVFRIIPTDGHPHRTAEETIGLSPSYMGDSIGRWEGDTLVVDTTDFNADIWLGIDGWLTTPKLHVIERLRRVDAHTILYRATVDDPATYIKPWTLEYPFVATAGPVYEYACHEGNYAMPDILGGARKLEAEQK